MAGDESLSEQFETIYDHLSLVDRRLDSMADEIEENINEIVADTHVDVEYDLDTCSFEATLPVGEICDRLNSGLESPIYAKVGENGQNLIVLDIRREVHIQEEGNSDENGKIQDVAGLIDALDSDHQDGVPLDRVVSILEREGFSRDEAENEVNALKQKGEVYEVTTGYLRTT